MTFIEQADDDGVYKASGFELCLGCHNQLDACRIVDPDQENRAPRPWDITICAHCGEIMVLNDDLTVRTPTLKDMLVLQDLPQWERVLEAQREARENPQQI